MKDFGCYEIGLVMLGAVTAEVAGRVTNSTYSWTSAAVYLVIAMLWLAAAVYQRRPSN